MTGKLTCSDMSDQLVDRIANKLEYMCRVYDIDVPDSLGSEPVILALYDAEMTGCLDPYDLYCTSGYKKATARQNARLAAYEVVASIQDLCMVWARDEFSERDDITDKVLFEYFYSEIMRCGDFWDPALWICQIAHEYYKGETSIEVYWLPEKIWQLIR